MKQKAELTSKKRREIEAVTDEVAGDRGGQFPGSKEYSGCHKCCSQSHFARNCSVRKSDDQPQKKKFQIRRDLDDSDNEDINCIEEVNGIIETYPHNQETSQTESLLVLKAQQDRRLVTIHHGVRPEVFCCRIYKRQDISVTLHRRAVKVDCYICRDLFQKFTGPYMFFYPK